MSTVDKVNDCDGKVLWYSDRLGYGVICGVDCETYFIHHSDILMGSMDERRHRKHLLEGEKVTFDWCWKVGTDNKKRQAINLKVVESEDM